MVPSTSEKGPQIPEQGGVQGVPDGPEIPRGVVQGPPVVVTQVVSGNAAIGQQYRDQCQFYLVSC